MRFAVLLLLLLALACRAAVGLSDKVCGEQVPFGGLVIKFPGLNSAPNFDYWYGAANSTRFMVNIESVHAYANGASYHLSKSIFASWTWVFDCVVECGDDVCRFGYEGDNKGGGAKQMSSLVHAEVSSDPDTNSFKFDIELFGPELEGVLANADRLDITFKFICTKGSCNDPKNSDDAEVEVSGDTAQSTLDLLLNTISIIGGDAPDCNLTVNEDGSTSEAGDCGLHDFTIIVNNKKPVVSISWDNAQNHTTIIFDPTVKVSSASVLSVSLVACVFMMLSFLNFN
jgi:hypothetical protein